MFLIFLKKFQGETGRGGEEVHCGSRLQARRRFQAFCLLEPLDGSGLEEMLTLSTV